MIRKFLDCSTAHVANETRLMLDSTPLEQWPVTGGRLVHGWFIYAHDEDSERIIPAELFAVMTRARAEGCDYILFDADAAVLDGLPTFDWGHEGVSAADARAATTEEPMMKLYALVTEIREEQSSDAIFGGQSTKERQAASRIYQSRIRAADAKIDDVLLDIAATLRGEAEGSELHNRALAVHEEGPADVMLAALKEIADTSPDEEPSGDYDDMEGAYNAGMDTAAFEKGSIARRAIAIAAIVPAT